MTGTLLFPANSPFAAFNGPAAYTGRIVSDGTGNFTGSVTGNINGLVTSYSLQGNYVVNDTEASAATHSPVTFPNLLHGAMLTRGLVRIRLILPESPTVQIYKLSPS
jgi:hypothetical protein